VFSTPRMQSRFLFRCLNCVLTNCRNSHHDPNLGNLARRRGAGVARQRSLSSGRMMVVEDVMKTLLQRSRPRTWRGPGTRPRRRVLSRPRLRDRAPYLIARLGDGAALLEQRVLSECCFAGGTAFQTLDGCVVINYCGIEAVEVRDRRVAALVEPELLRARWHAYLGHDFAIGLKRACVILLRRQDRALNTSVGLGLVLGSGRGLVFGWALPG